MPASLQRVPCELTCTGQQSVTNSDGPLSTTGQAVSKDDAGAQPTITIVGTDADFASGGSVSATAKYTIIMIDGDYAGATNANGVNTHYLQNDLSEFVHCGRVVVHLLTELYFQLWELQLMTMPPLLPPVTLSLPMLAPALLVSLHMSSVLPNY